MVSCGSTRDRKRCLEGHVGRLGQGVGREGRRLGTCFYQGLWVECFRILRLKQDPSIQTLKSWVSVSSTGVLSKAGGAVQGKVLGHCRWQRPLGSEVGNLPVLLWLLLRACLG